MFDLMRGIVARGSVSLVMFGQCFLLEGGDQYLWLSLVSVSWGGGRGLGRGLLCGRRLAASVLLSA